MLTAVLAARGLTKHFPVRRRLRDLLRRGRRVVHAVDGVDLELHRGRVTAMVGESGSGKSTVARLLAQLYPRTAGTIALHGRPVTVRGGRRFRAYCGQVQLIFQDPFASLNPAHTVRYHLTRALRLHGRPATDAATVLAEVALTPPERFLDRFPHELSGGQRQRVAIARALAARPQVLLADEPVSMLDVSIRLGILNLLGDLRDRLSLAILYITHDIASARYFADETLVMYAGRVVEGGASETVTQHAAHPYTRLLISSAPGGPGSADEPPGGYANEPTDGFMDEPLGGPADEPAPGGSAGEPAGGGPSGGEPPSLIAPPAGCRFHPRCPHVMPVCRASVPPRFDLGDDPGHWAACWLYGEPDPKGRAGSAGEADSKSRAGLTSRAGSTGRAG